MFALEVVVYCWGGQPLRWIPVNPDSSTGSLALSLECGLDLLTHIQWRKYGRSNEMSHWTSFLDTLVLSPRDASCHLIMQASHGEAHVARNWSWPAITWVRLETDPSLVELWDNCSPGWNFTACERLTARTTQLSCSLANRNCENLSVCCFQLLCFEVIWYTAIAD